MIQPDFAFHCTLPSRAFPQRLATVPEPNQAGEARQELIQGYPLLFFQGSRSNTEYPSALTIQVQPAAGEGLRAWALQSHALAGRCAAVPMTGCRTTPHQVTLAEVAETHQRSVH